MPEFTIQIGDAKDGPLCIVICAPAATEEEARQQLRGRLEQTGSQIILALPDLGQYVALKINPARLDEATVIRQGSS